MVLTERKQRIKLEQIRKQKQIKKICQFFVESFTKGMQGIEPTDKSDSKYDEKHKAWQLAFEFPKRLHIDIANFADHIVYAGNDNPNQLDTEIKVFPKFIDDLNNVLNSDHFDEYMNIAKPNIKDDDPEYDEKIKSWKKAFDFANKIQGFTKDVKKAIDANPKKFITGTGYYSYIISLIKRLESN